MEGLLLNLKGAGLVLGARQDGGHTMLSGTIHVGSYSPIPTVP